MRSGAGWPLLISRYRNHTRRPAIGSAIALRSSPRISTAVTVTPSGGLRGSGRWGRRRDYDQADPRTIAGSLRMTQPLTLRATRSRFRCLGALGTAFVLRRSVHVPTSRTRRAHRRRSGHHRARGRGDRRRCDRCGYATTEPRRDRAIRPDASAVRRPVRHAQLPCTARQRTNFKKAYLGYMASETVIAHNVITSGLEPRHMGWTDEAYRDHGNVFGRGVDEMHITGDLSLADFATIEKNNGAVYPKLADYLHTAYPGTKFITVGEKSYAVESATGATGDIGVRLGSRKSNFNAYNDPVSPGCPNLAIPTAPGVNKAWRGPAGKNVPSYLLASVPGDPTA